MTSTDNHPVKPMKVEPQNCPSCGSVATLDGGGRRWRYLCSKNNLTLISPCAKVGHTMFTKAEALRVWNELK